jgi:polyisoprenyl-phosphate glycosyltransferase
MRAAPSLLILIPIYNDWDAVTSLLSELDRVLVHAGLRCSVLLADDGSTTTSSGQIAGASYSAIDQVDVLTLRRNLGHQRAIAIALAFVQERIGPGAVIVMDGDGEDAPADVPRLVARSVENGGTSIVFAERRRRSESMVFRVFYGGYRLAHRLLTGIPVRVGNFSLIPASQLERLVVVSELWNHYAAAVFKARLPRENIPTVRASRLSGESRMNFVSLVGHGLSAFSVHAELIGVRLLVLTGVIVALACALFGAVIAVRFATPLAIPGWATTMAGFLIVILFQAVAFAAFFAFLVLHARSQPLFIPLRDYVHFVGRTATLTSASLVAVRSRALDSNAVPR